MALTHAYPACHRAVALPDLQGGLGERNGRLSLQEGWDTSRGTTLEVVFSHQVPEPRRTCPGTRGGRGPGAAGECPRLSWTHLCPWLQGPSLFRFIGFLLV